MKREVKLKRREMKKRIKYLERRVNALNLFRSYFHSYFNYELCPIKIVKIFPNDWDGNLNDEFVKKDIAYELGMFLFDHGCVDLKKEKFDDLHTRYVASTYGTKKGE